MNVDKSKKTLISQVSGDSTVYNKHGEGFSLSNFLSSGNSEVFGIDINTFKKIETKIVSYKYIDQIKPAILLRLNKESKKMCKNQHVYCINNGIIDTKKIEDLNKNDCVIVPKKLFTSESYEHNIYSNSFSFQNNISKNELGELNINIHQLDDIGNAYLPDGPMSNDIFYLAGYLAGQLAKQSLSLSNFEHLNNRNFKEEVTDGSIEMHLGTKSMMYEICSLFSNSFRIEPEIYTIDDRHHVLRIRSICVKEILFHIIFNAYKYNKTYIFAFLSGLNDCSGRVYFGKSVSAYMHLNIPAEMRKMRQIIYRSLRAVGVISASFQGPGIKINTLFDIQQMCGNIYSRNVSKHKEFIQLARLVQDGMVKKNTNLGFYLGDTLKSDLDMLKFSSSSTSLSSSMITKYKNNKFMNYYNAHQLALEMCSVYNPIKHESLKIADLIDSDIIGAKLQNTSDYGHQKMLEVYTEDGSPIIINDILCATKKYQEQYV